MKGANMKSISLMTLIAIISGYFFVTPIDSSNMKINELAEESLIETGTVVNPDINSQIQGLSFSELAEDLLDTPYNGKGSSPEEGFSTGTLVQYMYSISEGVLLSRYPHLQSELGEPVKKENLKEGDLVFFQGKKNKISAIYLKDQQFVVVTKDGVALRHLTSDLFWKKRFIEGKRLTQKEKVSLNPSTYKNHDHVAVREAISLLHRPYKLTGNTLAAFDCSFLVQHAFEEMDIHLPRITYQQFDLGKDISLENAMPGDVIYFSGTWQEGISHTGIYLGDHFFIHASGEEGETMISYLGEEWMKHFTGIKRFNELRIQNDHPAVKVAYEMINMPFSTQGESPEKGFNQSGFIHYAFKEMNNHVPRSGKNQWDYGENVPQGSEKPGDVMFFESDQGIHLPTLYIGNGQIITVREDKGVSIVYPKFSHYWTYDRHIGTKRYPIN